MYKLFGVEASYFELVQEQGFSTDLSVLLGKNPATKEFLKGGGIARNVRSNANLN